MNQLKTYIGTKLIEAMAAVNAVGAEGYQVIYADGYASWSPKATFEEAYKRTQSAEMSFGDAIYLLKLGHQVQRAGWNGKGMWLEMQTPDEHSKMTLPYVYLNYPPTDIYPLGARVPWLASQTDMLAEDWSIA